MKKVFLFASAAIAALAMVSCNKEIETPESLAGEVCPEGYYIEELEATYPVDPATRTAFNETTGKFAWTEGDELAFHLSNGTYTSAPIDPATSKVKLYLPVGVTRDNYAVYPASAVEEEHASKTDMKVTLPSTYDISDNLTTEFVPMPLIATNDADNKKLKFEHVGALLQVNLNVPAGVKTATLSMGKTITGTFSLASGSGNGIIEAGEVSDDALTFILSEEGLGDATTVKLLAPLPSGTYEKFEVAYDNGFAFTKDLSSNPWEFDRTYGKKVSIGEDKFVAPNYFWLEALEAGSTVQFGLGKNPAYDGRNLFYSLDRSEWHQYVYNETITLENEGDRVWFYSTSDIPLGDHYNSGTAYSNRNSITYAYDGSRFKGTGRLKAGGELAYLYKKAQEPIPNWAFIGLFSKMTSLIYADEIIFPDGAPEYSYYSMFYNCSNLETAPAVLPAMELSKSCYADMFYGCSSLVAGPDLPAKNAAESCYSYMFMNSGITVAPEIGLEHMAYNCCSRMFRDCDNLVVGPIFHNVDLAKNCFDGTFMGCNALVTAPVLPEVTELVEWCYYYMFQGCDNLTEVPFTLPATNVPKNAYAGMFWGCTSLEDNAMPTTPRVYDIVEADGMQGMYANCKSLKNVVVPDILQPVGGAGLASMFAGCSGLETAEVLTTHFYSADDMRTSDGTLFDLFYNCTNLAAITVYFTEWSYMRTDQWVMRVGSTGSFRKPASLPETYGDTQIPTGWTVYNLEDLEGGI